MALTDQTISFTTQQLSFWVDDTDGMVGPTSTIQGDVIRLDMVGAPATIQGDVIELDMLGPPSTTETSGLESHLIAADIIYYGDEANIHTNQIVLLNNIVVRSAYPVEAWGMANYVLSVFEPIENKSLSIDESSSVVINTRMPSSGTYTLPNNAPPGTKFIFTNSSDSGVIINSYRENEIRYLDESGVSSTAHSCILHSIGSRATLICDNNKKWLAISENDISYVRSPLPTSLPSDISGLSLWLDAADSDTMTITAWPYVSEWRDKSGNNNHVTQSLLPFRPSYDGQMNGLPTLVFDGIDDYLINNFPGGTFNGKSGDFYFVTQVDDGYIFTSTDVDTGLYYFRCILRDKMNFNKYNNSTYNSLSDSSNMGTSVPHLIRYSSSGSSYTFEIDGSIRTMNLDSGSNNGDWLGDVANRDSFLIGAVEWPAGVSATYLRGKVAEIIYFDGKVLDASERAQIEAYLNNKWGI